jgi:hypothetical protein
LTTTTPILTGISLLFSRYQKLTRFSQPFFFVLSILVAVLTSLVGPYASGNVGELCVLGSKWANLYRDHNGKAIKTIEEALQCCGFNGPMDDPWPRPTKGHLSPCTELYGWQGACRGVWGGAQRAIAKALLVVLIVSWILHVSDS